LGRSGFGKTHKIRQIIKKEVFEGNENIILLVPEQNSFENERILLESIGEKFYKNIQVLSFDRMINVALKDPRNSMLTGISCSKKFDEVGCKILMYRALNQVKNQLEIYKNQSDSTEFIDLMVLAKKELKSNGIDANILLGKSVLTKNLFLSKKMKDVGTILLCFESLASDISDPLDNLTAFYKLLLAKSIFSGHTILIDGFDFFTKQQLDVLELIMKQSKKCYVSLCLDHLHLKNSENISIFSPTIKTMKILSSIAQKINLKILNPIILSTPYRFKNNSLKTLEQNVFRENYKRANLNDNVTIYRAQDIYDECDFVARSIKKLVMEGDYKYKDFSIITRSVDEYKDVIGTTLDKYDIAFCMDSCENISDKPLVRLILLIFDMVHSNFSIDYVVEYIKMDAIGLSRESSLLLENYIFTWQIKGEDWLNDFKQNPRGFSSKLEDEEKKELFIVNQARKKIIGPLIEFSNSIKTSIEVRKISLAVYNFLIALKIPQALSTLTPKLPQDVRVRESSQAIKLWKMIMEIMDKMVTFLDKERVNSQQYVSLFRMAVCCSDMEFIPARLDEVKVGSIDKTRPEKSKVVFVVGAVSSRFPKDPEPVGIFSEKDRKNLASVGIFLRDFMKELLLFERFLAYKSLTCAREKIFTTFYAQDISGEKCCGSIIIEEICKSFENLKIIDFEEEDAEEKIWTKNKAFEFYAKHKKETPVSEVVYDILATDGKYLSKIKALENSQSNINLNFISVENSNRLFSTPLKLSATQIQQYNLCGFRYFCRYGILVKQKRCTKFGNLEYGNLLHFLMENIFSRYSIEQLNNDNKQSLLNKIWLLLIEYKDLKLGVKNFSSARFEFLFSRIQKFAYILIDSVLNEFLESNFKPIGCEVTLSSGFIDELNKPLLIKFDNEIVASVEGKIDRLDVLRRNKQNLIRVIDYKLSKKELDISDILNGLDMQMPIYLAAMTENLGENFFPSGMLYAQLKTQAIDISKNISHREITRKIKMNGLILKDLNKITTNRRSKRKIFNEVDLSDMNLIFKLVKRRILNITLKIQGGDFQINPVKKDKFQACDFCEYYAICRYNGGSNERIIKKLGEYDIDQVLRLFKSQDPNSSLSLKN
jgi:ATP-dependent helicase/nuclease subunit B